MHLVLRSRAGTAIPFRVLVDGEAPGAAHGLDVDEEGRGTLVQPRLYQLVRERGSITDRTFEIAFLDAGNRDVLAQDDLGERGSIWRTRLLSPGERASEDAGLAHSSFVRCEHEVECGRQCRR